MYSVGGVRSAIETLSAKQTLSVGRETNALPHTNNNNTNDGSIHTNNNNTNDGSIGGNNNSGKAEKSVTSEFAHLSITYQENSTAGQPTTDKTAVLPVVSYIQASTEDDGSAFKLLINEAIGGLPALPKDMEKNNDSIYTNHQGAERTDK